MIRIAYFKARPGQQETEHSYNVELAPGEFIVSVEKLHGGGHNADWHRVYVVSAAVLQEKETT